MTEHFYAARTEHGTVIMAKSQNGGERIVVCQHALSMADATLMCEAMNRRNWPRNTIEVTTYRDEPSVSMVLPMAVLPRIATISGHFSMLKADPRLSPLDARRVATTHDSVTLVLNDIGLRHADTAA